MCSPLEKINRSQSWMSTATMNHLRMRGDQTMTIQTVMMDMETVERPKSQHPTLSTPKNTRQASTEKGSTDYVLDVLEDLGDGHEPLSSSSKPPKKDKKKEDYKRFELFYDDTVDPYKMPDGRPVPKGYVHDGVRLVRYRKGSKRVPGYPSDLCD